MVICPKCRSKIPAWKLMFLTNFNTITCLTCSTRLQANRRISSLIGGIGGGIGGGLGALLAILWLHTKEASYVMLFILLILALFFASWLATVRLVKLEVKHQHV